MAHASSPALPCGKLVWAVEVVHLLKLLLCWKLPSSELPQFYSTQLQVAEAATLEEAAKLSQQAFQSVALWLQLPPLCRYCALLASGLPVLGA